MRRASIQIGGMRACATCFLADHVRDAGHEGPCHVRGCRVRHEGPCPGLQPEPSGALSRHQVAVFMLLDIDALDARQAQAIANFSIEVHGENGPCDARVVSKIVKVVLPDVGD